MTIQARRELVERIRRYARMFAYDREEKAMVWIQDACIIGAAAAAVLIVLL